MKNLPLTLLLLLFINNLLCQGITVLAETDDGQIWYKKAFHGDHLYFTVHDTDYVARIDVTETSPVIETVVSGLNKPGGVAIYGNELYIADHGDDAVYKIQVNQANPVLETVLTNVTQPRVLCIDGDFLYIGERAPNNRISRIDLTEENPTLTEIVTDIEYIQTMEIHGNHLYFANNSATLKAIDLSDTFPATFSEAGSYPQLIRSIVFDRGNLYTPGGWWIIRKSSFKNINPKWFFLVRIREDGTSYGFPYSLILRGNNFYIGTGGNNDGKSAILKYELKRSNLRHGKRIIDGKTHFFHRN